MRLNELVSILSGYAFDSNLFNETGVGIPIIRIRDVGKNKVSTFYSGDFNKNFIIQKGDFLIGMDGDFRLAKWKCQDALLNQRVCKIEVKSTKLNADYLYYFLPKELKIIEDSTSFATVKHLSVKKIQEIQIPLPPLPTQQKIASILDAADTLRQKDKALLAKYDELTQSLFLDMFGDYLNGRLFPLKDLVRFSQGQQFGVEQQLLEPKEGYARFLRIVDYTQGEDLRFVPNNSKSYYVSKEDIVIVRYGASAGFVGTNKEGVLANNLFKVNYDNLMYNHVFLYFIFQNDRFKKFVNKEAFGAAMPALSFKVMERFEIPVPPLNLQTQFAERVTIIEQQKAIAQASLEKSEELFNSLLQKAFKGELV
jgi:type I restriction enzyme S subunit